MSVSAQALRPMADDPPAGHSPESEQHILDLFATPYGQDEAFRRLVAAYREPLYRLIRKLVIRHEDADDVLQDTFIKALNGLAGFRGEARLSTWLYRIATNEALGFLRKQKRRSWLSFSDASEVLEQRLEADPYFDGDAAETALQKAVLRLPDQQRLVFHMRYYEEMPYKQMAEITGLTMGALKAHYHHAVKKIQKQVGEDFAK